MDPSLLAGLSGSSGVQGMSGGHHHHRKSISDQVNQMGTAIDNALSAGTMTSDQASALKKELADITKTLAGAQTSSASSTAQTNKTNPLSQLSEDDRKKIFSELQDVRKQLKAASSQASGADSGSDAVSKLFSQLDTDANGAISKDEFKQFLAQVGATVLGYTQNGTSNAASGNIFSAIG
jgi:chromosome segregation ATPase